MNILETNVKSSQQRNREHKEKTNENPRIENDNRTQFFKSLNELEQMKMGDERVTGL